MTKTTITREQLNALYRAERIMNNPKASVELVREASAIRKNVVSGDWKMKVMDAARSSYSQAHFIHFTGWLNNGSINLGSRRYNQFTYLVRRNWLARMGGK